MYLFGLYSCFSELVLTKKTASDETSSLLKDFTYKGSPLNVTSDIKLNATKESINETSFQILLMTIRWARNFPSYSNLCIEDQVSQNQGFHPFTIITIDIFLGYVSYDEALHIKSKI